MALPLPEAPCACCFRRQLEKWTWAPQAALVAVVRHDRPPYADILCAWWSPAHEQLVRVCDRCNQFLRRRVGPAGRVRRGRPHPMQLTVEFLFSGGLTLPPPRHLFERCLGLLLDEPTPPLLALEGLRERLVARRRLQNADCIVRWLFAGRPRALTSLAWGRRMRRWRSLAHTNQACAWILDDDSVSACRFCSSSTQADGEASYAGVLDFGQQPAAQRMMEARLREMEASFLVPGESDEQDAARIARWVASAEGVLFFCPHCRRLGVLSHAYHCALWPRLGLTPIAAADAYYSHALARLAKKKNALARGALPAKPTKTTPCA